MSIDSHFEDKSDQGEGGNPDRRAATLFATLFAAAFPQIVSAEEPPPPAVLHSPAEAQAPRGADPANQNTVSPGEKPQKSSPLAMKRPHLGPDVEGGVGVAWDTRNLTPEAARLFGYLFAGLAIHPDGSRNTGRIGFRWAYDPNRLVQSTLEGADSQIFEIPVPEHCFGPEGVYERGILPEGKRVQLSLAVALTISYCMRPQVAAVLGDKTIGTFPATPAFGLDGTLSFGLTVRLLQQKGYQLSFIMRAGNIVGLRASKAGTDDGVIIPIFGAGFRGEF